jgi:hypothetical protein
LSLKILVNELLPVVTYNSLDSDYFKSPALSKMPPSHKTYYGYYDPLMTILKRRSTVLFTSLLLGIAILVWYHAPYGAVIPSSRNDHYPMSQTKVFNGTWDYERDRDNLMLGSSQCDQAFPGLFEEINRPMKDRRHRRISLDEIDSITPQNGYVRAMIYDQQVSSRMILYLLNLANETPIFSFTSLLLEEVYTRERSLPFMLCTGPLFPHQSAFLISNSLSTQTIG